ncbi:hypothetical protein BZ13_1582 [Francisella philomiragia subsp. philomiragia ATCC 25015]|uniref:hypothetical protein n=1 Tax=Francisella philomiragia TaxID=28110 RepID=UPI0001AF7943|nr:hypothetical protein [Francisella philomiragia]AJI75102.1 hypothetical protein BZ13_1582 [Francisella philomiragia subsp. philomiragia ATCC 25015]EET20234.1 conserved hypothetical protein [Francisella philomiragia subsp. philomiragia ATCC 25015]MBK2237278.1 hypothetical protein [Francisella philomiragia]
MEGSERIVSSGVLSEYLSIGERRIQQLTSQDILKKTGKNQYPLKENVNRYIGYLQDRAGGKSEQELNIEFKKQKLRLTKFQADEQQVKAELAQKKVVAVNDVISSLADLFALMREKLLNIPERAEYEIFGETDKDIFNQKLSTEIKEALFEICDNYTKTVNKVIQAENITDDEI